MKASKWRRSLSIMMSVIVLCGTIQSAVLPVYAMENDIADGSVVSENDKQESETGSESESKNEKESSGSESGEKGGNEAPSTTETPSDSGAGEQPSGEGLTEGTGTEGTGTEGIGTEGTGTEETGETKAEGTESEGTDTAETKEEGTESETEDSQTAQEEETVILMETGTATAQSVQAAVDAEEESEVRTGTCSKSTKDNLTWKLKDGVLTISGTGDMKSYQSYSSYRAPWYEYRDQITSVVVEPGVTSIGAYAFYGCTKLTGIEFPSTEESDTEESDAKTKEPTVTSIGNYAFSGCTALESFEISSPLVSVGNYAFNGCTALENVKISVPESYTGNTNIAGYAFYKCTALKSAVLPDTVNSIGSYAFSECSSLTSMDIPKKVTSISSYTFYNCKSLESVTIPDTVTKIATYAFCYCQKLGSVTLPSALQTMESYAFFNCAKLTSVDTSKCTKWKAIPEYAFAYCSMLPEFTIPEQVTQIGGAAFIGDSGLTEMTIPETVKTLGSSMFYGCSNLKTVTLPSKITEIPGSMFQSCTSLTEITIPETVTSIGGAAFSGCTGLTEIKIPESVTSIGNNAFTSCSKITEIELPSGLTTIAGGLFNGCTALNKVNIPDGVTSIGNNAFNSCSKLKSITLPEGLKTIGDYAFSSCNRLTSITLPAELTSIGYSAFSSDALSTIVLESKNLSSVYAKSNNTFGSGLSDVYIESGVETLGSSFISSILYNSPGVQIHFNGPNNFTYSGSAFTADHVTLTEGSYHVTEDGIVYQLHKDGETYTATLMNCPSDWNAEKVQTLLNTESVESNGTTYTVTAIGDHVFEGRKDLTEITIPSKIESIGASAFADCTGLTCVTIPNTLKDLGISAFAGCTKLEKVKLSDTSKPETEYEEYTSVTGLIVKLGNMSAFLNTPLMKNGGVKITDGILTMDTEDYSMQLSVGSTSDGEYDSQNTLQLWTGQYADISISIDHLNKDVDGNAVVYFQFEDGNTVEETGKLFGYDLDVWQDFEKKSDENHKYISGKFEKTETPGCYRLVLRYLYAGNTLNLNLKASYYNGSSGGGSMLVWMELEKNGTTTEDQTSTSGSGSESETLIAETVMNMVTWNTKPDKFTVSKKWDTSYTPTVSGDGTKEGPLTVSNLVYTISMNKESGIQYGKDYMKQIEYVDTLKLPKGFSWREGLIDAIKNKDYRFSVSYNSSTSRYVQIYVTINENGTDKTLQLAQLNGPAVQDGGYYGPFSLSVVSVDDENEESEEIQIHWTWCNSKNTEQEIKIPSFRLSFGSRVIQVDLAKLENNQDEGSGEILKQIIKEIPNEVEYIQSFTYSEDVTGSDTAIANVKINPANFSISKSGYDSATMGGKNTYTISLSNSTSLPYTGIYMVEDPIPDWFYIEPSDMITMFNNTEMYGKDLTITIKKASLYELTQQQVIAENGYTYTLDRPLIGNASDSKYAFNATGAKDTPKATDVEITIQWENATELEMSVKNGETTKSYIVAANASALKAKLTEIGFAVTADVQYTCTWNLENYTLYSGQTQQLSIPTTTKNTFMKLTEDRRNYYSSTTSYVATTSNTAKAYYTSTAGRSYKYASKNTRIYKDFTLYKSASLNGKSITKSTEIVSGDVVTYTSSVSRVSTAVVYSAVPLVDHMQGGQVLLVLASENTSLKDLDLPIQTVNGKEYYALNQPGTYERVKVGGYLADHVEVSATSAGLDTMIYWYLNMTSTKATDMSDTVTYYALISPELAGLNTEGINQYTLSNKIWLGDDEACRLYDVCYIYGNMLRISKYEVTNAEIPVLETHDPDADTLTKRSTIEAGRKVTYRLMLTTVGTSSTTIKGSSIYDALPESVDNYWSEENVSVTYIPASSGQICDITEGSGWYIEDGTRQTTGATQQKLKWSDDFRIYLNGTLYIYVTLEFPTDSESSTAWTDYVHLYGASGLTNTWHVYDLTDTVTHDMSVQAEVRLQKGVYATGSNTSTSSNYTKSTDTESLLFYNNTTNNNQNGIVTYYVSLYNSGMSRMYLSDIQDILPEGFTFASLYYPYSLYYSSSQKTSYNNSNYYASVALVKDEARTVSYRQAGITATTEKVNGRQLVTFKLAGLSSSTTNNLLYDSGLSRYYLMPGQAVVFAFNCYTGLYANSKDSATNVVTMDYYDYNGAGVKIDKETSIASNNKTKILNDGDCDVYTTQEIEDLGMKTSGKTSSTVWLTSDVTVERGTISPGIKKVCTVELASTTDTIKWNVTAFNNGTAALRDYTLTDVMMNPYQFTGDVTYTIYRSTSSTSSTSLLSMTLFKIVSRTDTAVTIQYGSSNTKAELKLDGTPTTIKTSAGDAQVSISKDSNENEVLSIHMMDSEGAAIPASGKAILSVNTKNNTNLNENKTFINKCYLTPNAQEFDATAISQGSYTQYDLPYDESSEILPSVVSEAQVGVSYGYATKSVKRVTELTTDGKSASSNSANNYIVLADGMESTFRYDLQVENSGGNSVPRDLNLLVLVDNLPEVGDHTTFYEEYARYSDFQVDFTSAENLNPVVTVKTSDGKSKTLSSDQYTLQFSKQTSLNYAKNSDLWDGKEMGPKDGWYTLSELSENDLDLKDMRSLRVVIEDPEETGMLPAKSTVTFSFNANIHDDPENIPSASQIAWNSFGYLYQIGSLKLQASPLNVGVKIAGVPQLVKTLVDTNKKLYTADEDETFRFIICKGSVTQLSSQSTEADKLKWLSDMEIPFSVADLTVAKGQSASDVLKLDQLKVCTYDAGTGSYKETEEIWNWSDKASYTVTELPQEGGNGKYTFGNINSNKLNQYVFTYDKAASIRLTVTNVRKEWDLQLLKTDGSKDKKLSGAIFGLYSRRQSDQMAEDAAIPDDLNVKPEWTITNDDGTWYLMDIQTTDADGQIKWSKLTEDDYYVLELQAPLGYRLGKNPGQVVKWTAGSEVEQVNVVNASIFQLPHTGGMGTTLFTISGLCLIGAGLLYMWLKRRKKR